MYIDSIKGKIICNLSNSIGWNTNHKIVVIESDDWGSVRTHDADAYKSMKKFGLPLDTNHYNAVDALETNDDLQSLFSLLKEFKDATGRPPVITPVCIMGNPDFVKIGQSGFKQYFFQPLHETLKTYPDHDQVLELWRKGKEERLFVPALHGREHINVRRYMKLLQSEDEGIHTAFKNFSVGVSSYKGVSYPNYLGALYPESREEVSELHLHLEEAGMLFEKYMGEKPRFFVAPNAEEPKELELTLSKIGVKYIGRAKRRTYPLGDGTFKKEWNWVGKRNHSGQTILTRNCFFEPVSWGEYDPNLNWVENCMKEIEIAFRWYKPAVISSHRVNYIGFIRKENKEKGLEALRQLLMQIIKKWPEVEFMTSMELGDLINSKKKK